jgi:hypothetical protein
MSIPLSKLNFSTVYGNPKAQITIDNNGNLNMNPATDAAVLFNNLSLSGTSSSDPTATITADASGDILLTPASGAKCNIGGVVLYTSDDTQYIQSNGFSNLCIGNGDENAIAIQSTNVITLNGLEISGGTTGTTISPVSDTASVSMTGASIELNSLYVNASTSPTISSNNAMTLSASSINFTPSCGYLQMSQTPYYYNTGSGKTFNIPASGVYILSMAANDNSYADCLTAPQYTDSWMVFSSGSSTTAYPYSTAASGTSAYTGFNGVANEIIGITTSSSANSISIQIDNSAGYFYYFFLTKLV